MSLSSSQTLPDRTGFWGLYQSILAIVITFLCFSDIDAFFFDLKVIPPPSVIIPVIGVLSLPLLVPFKQRLADLPWATLAWCGLYYVITYFSYLILPEHEGMFQDVRSRNLDVIFILTTCILFSGSTRIQMLVRRTMFVVMCLSVVNNIIEMSISDAFNGVNLSGRPAGFYFDPNKSGCAIVLGVIFGATTLPPRWRIWGIAIGAVGIALTFSRGAMLSLPIVCAILMLGQYLPKRQFWTALISLVILLITLNLSAPTLVKQARYAGANENVAMRIETFANPTSKYANDDDSRLTVIETAVKTIQRSPWLGMGPGFINVWGDIPPHNMYLRFAVEHGIFGALIYPLFVLSCRWRATGQPRYLIHALVVFALIWGMFSHRSLSERFMLLSIVLGANMSVQSQFQPPQRALPGMN